MANSNLVAANLVARATAANVLAASMIAANQERRQEGLKNKFTEEDFCSILDTYRLTESEIMAQLADANEREHV